MLSAIDKYAGGVFQPDDVRILVAAFEAAQLAFMANRYFERAKELEQEVRFQSIPILHHEEARMG